MNGIQVGILALRGRHQFLSEGFEAFPAAKAWASQASKSEATATLNGYLARPRRTEGLGRATRSCNSSPSPAIHNSWWQVPEHPHCEMGARATVVVVEA